MTIDHECIPVLDPGNGWICSICHHSCDAPSPEINYNEMKVWQEIVTAIEPYCQLPHSNDMAKIAAETAQKIMAPYLATRKPVSVSLKDMRALINALPNLNDGIKAVLDAAGVKYVD